MPETRKCPHGFHHPGIGYSTPHSCDGCWCEGEHDRSEFGWRNDTTPRALVGHGTPEPTPQFRPNSLNEPDGHWTSNPAPEPTGENEHG